MKCVRFGLTNGNVARIAMEREIYQIFQTAFSEYSGGMPEESTMSGKIERYKSSPKGRRVNVNAVRSCLIWQLAGLTLRKVGWMAVMTEIVPLLLSKLEIS